MPDAALPAQIDPETVVTSDGESLPIDQVDLDTLASWIDQLREMKDSANGAISAISSEIVRRADLNVRTQVDGTQRFVRVTGAEPTPRWDPLELGRVLSNLVVDGTLSHESIRGVVERVVTWKVDTTTMKRLCKNPAVKAATDPIRLPPEEPQRRVTSTGWLS